MWFVYVLYSVESGKTYVGFSNDVDRRLFEHNVSESKGFTLRYRPWTLIRREAYESKPEATKRERFLKTGRGRDEIKTFITEFLLNDGAVSAAAEKD
jgi:putative endonuclease